MATKRNGSGALLLLALAIGLVIAPSTARAEVDCHWSAVQCRSGYECGWDSARQIHRCMPMEKGTNNQRVAPTPAPQKRGRWMQNEYWPEAVCIVYHGPDGTDGEEVADSFCADENPNVSTAPVPERNPSQAPAAPRAATTDLTAPTQQCEPRSLDECLECECSVCLQSCKRQVREQNERCRTPGDAPAQGTPMEPRRFRPDCRRLVNENHPDCVP